MRRQAVQRFPRTTEPVQQCGLSPAALQLALKEEIQEYLSANVARLRLKPDVHGIMARAGLLSTGC